MKSTLKTFLAGKNPYRHGKLVGAQALSIAALSDSDYPELAHFYDNESFLWVIDVLDDGTAITYEITTCDTSTT